MNAPDTPNPNLATPIGPHRAILAREHEDGVALMRTVPNVVLHLTKQEAAHLLRWLGARAARIAAAGDEPVCTIDLMLRDDAANALWSRSKTLPAPKRLAENVNLFTLTTGTMRLLLDDVVDEHGDPSINDSILRLVELTPELSSDQPPPGADGEGR